MFFFLFLLFSFGFSQVTLWASGMSSLVLTGTNTSLSSGITYKKVMKIMHMLALCDPFFFNNLFTEYYFHVMFYAFMKKLASDVQKGLATLESSDLKSGNIRLPVELCVPSFQNNGLTNFLVFYFRPFLLFLKPIKIYSATELSRATPSVKLAQEGTKTRGTRMRNKRFS